MLRDFGKHFLPKDSADLPMPPQQELDLAPCQLRWVQASTSSVASTAVSEVLEVLKTNSKSHLSISDLSILVDSQELGRKIVDLLGDRGMRCINTFEQDKQEGRRKKLAFFMGDARVKATTLHSFKGWESRALVMCIENAQDHRSLALMYSGLTRLKRSPQGSFLTVVCSAPELAAYGKSW